jgi:AcrR family transcriptional regulator
MAPIRRRASRLPATVRREQIIEKALETFARSNFREASTAAIAAALGISEPTLFRHFPTKRALYLAALDRSFEIVFGGWREIAASSATPFDALLQVGRWYVSELHRDPRHLLLRFRSYGETADPEVATRVRTHFVEVFQFVQQLLEGARAAGQIDRGVDVRTHAWVFMAVGALLDMTQLLGLRGELRHEDMAVLVQMAVPTLGPPPPSEPPA